MDYVLSAYNNVLNSLSEHSAIQEFAIDDLIKVGESMKTTGITEDVSKQVDEIYKRYETQYPYGACGSSFRKLRNLVQDEARKEWLKQLSANLYYGW